VVAGRRAPAANADAAADLRALVALITGAMIIGASPLLVRLSEVGPLTTAFWRVALALPVLAAWSAIDGRRRPRAPAPGFGAAMSAGLFFAADLAIWHTSLALTSVANATFLVNMAPLVVAVTIWLVYRERPSRRFTLGVATALVGVLLLMQASFGRSPRELVGDVVALGAAVALAGYMLAVRSLRTRHSTARIMMSSSTACALALAPVMLLSGETLWPASASGMLTLCALALLCHVGGQGLIAYSLSRLPAAFSSLALLIEPLVAAILAWVLLGEALGAAQVAGGAAILAGIAIARGAAGAGTGRW